MKCSESTTAELQEVLGKALRFLQRWEAEKQWLWAIGIRRRLGLSGIIHDIKRVLPEPEVPPLDQKGIDSLAAKYKSGRV